MSKRPSGDPLPKASRHRPCVACAGAQQSHEWRAPSKAGPCVALAPVWASKRRAPQMEEEPPLRLWRARQLPLGRPSEDSNVCICGQSRNDRARCARVVYRSEQSSERVYLTRRTGTGPGSTASQPSRVEHCARRAMRAQPACRRARSRSGTVVGGRSACSRSYPRIRTCLPAARAPPRRPARPH